MNKIHKAFLDIVKAGLWGTVGQLSSYGKIDFSNFLQISNEQGVLGLVAAGLERVSDVKIPQTVFLQFIGRSLQIEQRNKAMNQFIAELVEEMRSADIYAILVKGQGVAQCYEKPLWRPNGDIDFLLSTTNYDNAVFVFKSFFPNGKKGGQYSKEFTFYANPWKIELHGTLRTCLSERVDKEVDAAQNSVFLGGNVRLWQNGGSHVLLPAPTEDVFLVFTHFIKHFYRERMTLRQVCDWCRLLYTYKESLNYRLLKSWIKKAGLMKEWRVFADLAVNWLGMPEMAMPFFDAINKKDDEKGERLVEFILGGYSGNKLKDTLRIAKIFPWKALRYSPSIFLNVNWLKVKERLFNSR